MTTTAQVHAAEALSNLANGNDRAQNMIAKAGGIGPLLALLSNKSTKAQAQGSSAIAQITRRNRDNQDSFSKSGGMPQLVGLLTSTDLEVQAMAALAITEVCRDNHENQTSAAECGCIASIVEQLKSNSTSAGVDEVKAEAVGAIWVISDKHPDNKTAVARAGGIQPTVSILAGGTPRAQEHAAYALSALGFDNVENQKQITSLLVSLLSTGSNEAKQNSTSLLLRLVEENPESQQDIATAGPMADLIGLLKEGSDGAKRFALWSLSLSINESNQKQLLEEGAIDPLVDTLNSTVPASRQQAAAAISRLANKNSKTQLEVAKKGGITPLIAIVNGVEGPGGTSPTEVAAAAATASVGSNSSVDNGGEAGGGVRKASRRPSLMVADHATSDIEAKQYAAAALAALASLPKVGKEIVDSGGLEPLVALLNGGDNLGKQYAAASLARLATRGPKAPAALEPAKAISAIQPLVTLLTGDCGDKAQEEAAGALFALADEVNNRIAITDAGGIGPLVTLLGSSNSESQKHAKGVLVRLSIESANRALIIKKLVDMLGGSSSEGSSAQEQAAAALANLASDSAENRVSIVDAGGIEPLLSIIGHKENSKAKEESLKAISKLAYNSESIQSAITQAGGIPLLVNAMASSSNAKEMMASAGLYSLAANALSQLAKGNCDNQVKITEAGAIPSLVAILGAPVPDLQANAAECLGNLSAGNPDNQAAIARTGAIAPLCTLLREGADEVKEQAAAALWSLSLDNKPNKDTVAKLGGVEPLVTLLVTGTSDNSLDQATGALASMCSKHMENRETIAKLIVNRLASKNAMLQTPTGAVRLLSAVGKMCHGSNANQAAIAKAGGVPPLIMWLSGGFDTGAKGTTNAEAQAAAADALLSMVSGNDPLQAMISRSNGIAPLIELLANGTMDTQVGVCRLLWHLCGNGESATAILTGGGVQPLCNMLTLDDPKAQELAATVMLKLIKSNSACCVTIAELGGVVSLVKLSKDGTAAGQQQATCSLAEIAMVPANREIIAEAGGVDVLVGLLTSSVVGTSETAARALANLARNTTLTDESGNVVDEQASLEACAARRKKIAECGGTKQLIGMLSAVSLSSSIIARKMWELVSKVIGASPSPPPTGGAEQGEVAGSVKATKKPVNEEECIGVQEQAAATLADLAFGDAAMQHAIIHDGGVPPLLALLRSSSQFSQENAARAIWHLCESASNQGLIVEAGAINELVALSKTGSARAQGFAAAVISDLAKGAIAEKAGQEGDEEGGSQGEVEGAPKAAESDRLSVIAAAGKEKAASALNNLMKDERNRDTVAKSGGIPPLVQLLDDVAPQAHVHAVAALASLAAGAPDNQTQIAKKLVALLSLQSEGPQRRSAQVLFELAANNTGAPVRIVNAGAISPLVSLMGSGSVDAYDHAVGALSCLALNDKSNQLAIATGLVGLLKLPGADAHDRLDEMVTQFAEAKDIRAAIAEAGSAVRSSDDGGEGGEGGGGEEVQEAKKGKRKAIKRVKSERRAVVASGADGGMGASPASDSGIAEEGAPGVASTGKPSTPKSAPKARNLKKSMTMPDISKVHKGGSTDSTRAESKRPKTPGTPKKSPKSGSPKKKDSSRTSTTPPAANLAPIADVS